MKTEQLQRLRLHEASGDYSERLIESIDASEDRILLETMVLDQNGRMDDVLLSCIEARRRGVGVLMVYDIYSHIASIGNDGFVDEKLFRNRLDELRQEGIVVQKVGSRQLNPFAGRHHAKAAVIDDHVYVGGGVNLTGSSFDTKDYMVRFDDKELAQTLYDTLPVLAASRDRDQVLFSTDTNEILLDAGHRGSSLIYDRTCDLAEQAVAVTYVSKLAPDDRLSSILQMRNTKYWYNTIKSASSFDKLAIFIDQMKTKVPNEYTGESVLHAKFCVFDMPDGTKQAITGSHNFNSRGVAFGTQELAIHTKDQGLCEQLISFSEDLSKKE